ncbi:unnamed protein product [Cyprideis torosa]|uniref:non-specific serine/threonine protein kinase n=1 Tax=Cyprideis torosa TaxID=163714 RepID=A0A7R8ZJW1_9CRUS|nr:unnamed protein product [Cyprideis torosa]CAG0889405.1 unnamed protein product [Cyprideis torosa]
MTYLGNSYNSGQVRSFGGFVFQITACSGEDRPKIQRQNENKSPFKLPQPVRPKPRAGSFGALAASFLYRRNVLSRSPLKLVSPHGLHELDFNRGISGEYRCKRLSLSPGGPGPTENSPAVKRRRLAPVEQQLQRKRKKKLQYSVPSHSRDKRSLNVDSANRRNVFDYGLEHLDTIEVLGRGGFGVVVRARSKGREVAAKIIPRNNQKGKRTLESTLQGELNAIKLNHPNIVKTLFIYGFHERNALVIMELAGKLNLQTLIDDPNQPLGKARREKYAHQIAGALACCHDNQILHMDVKPSNIIVSDEDNCKLGDFGCSKLVDQSTEVPTFASSPLRGTVVYQAPEVLKGYSPTDKSDIYSFAITLWQMLSREQPFKGENMHVVLYRVAGKGERPPVCGLAKTPDDERYVWLVKRCWVQEPGNRLSARTIEEITLSWVIRTVI